MDLKLNYYLLLGLCFAPQENNLTIIRQAIENKRAEWSRLVNTPKGYEFSRYLSILPTINRELLDANIRLEHATAAQKIKTSKLKSLEEKLLFWGIQEETPQQEFSALHKFGITQQEIEDCIRRVAYKQSQSEKNDFEVIEENIQRDLQSILPLIGKKDIYDFLQMKRSLSPMDSKVCAEQKAKDLRMSVHKSAQLEMEKIIAQHALTIFKNTQTKRKYDNYLLLSKYKELDKQVLQFVRKRNNCLPTDKYYGLSALIAKNYNTDFIQAGKVVKLFCSAYAITIESEKQPTKICDSCKTENPYASKLCGNCGCAMAIHCNRCDTINKNTASVCIECGLQFENIETIKEYIQKAEQFFIAENYADSILYIEKSIFYLPNHPLLKKMQAEIQAYDAKNRHYHQLIKELMDKTHYFTADTTIKQAQKEGIILDELHTKKVTDMIAYSKEQLEIAKVQPEEKLFEMLISLSTQVADCTDIGTLLAKFPPPEPTNLTIENGASTFSLKWESEPSTNIIYYRVIRKKNIPPLHKNDGEIIYEGCDTQFVDTTPEVLQNYYYALYAIRANVTSKSYLVSKKVILIPPVCNVKVFCMDEKLEITWDSNKQAKEIIVVKSFYKDKEKNQDVLENASLDGVSDFNLINNQKYTYYICAQYLVGGQQVQSEIVSIMGMPKKGLVPIIGFQVSLMDQIFVALWDSSSVKPENSVLLLYTTTYPTHKVGMVMWREEILEKYEKLNPLSMIQGQASFQIPKNSVIYLTPCQSYADQVVLGEPIKITDICDVQNLRTSLEGTTIFLNFDVPNTAEYIAVAYRYDRYPISIQDAMHTSYYSKEQYELNSAITISDVKKGTYYITVYCVGTNAAAEQVFSNGVNSIVFNEEKVSVDYSVKYAKPLLSNQCSLYVTISCKKNIVLPRVMFIKKAGETPKTILDGEVIAGIECETSLSGEITYKFAVESFAKDSYVAMFFDDALLIEKFTLNCSGGNKVN